MVTVTPDRMAEQMEVCILQLLTAHALCSEHDLHRWAAPWTDCRSFRQVLAGLLEREVVVRMAGRRPFWYVGYALAAAPQPGDPADAPPGAFARLVQQLERQHPEWQRW